jgi:hypothetical protein
LTGRLDVGLPSSPEILSDLRFYMADDRVLLLIARVFLAWLIVFLLGGVAFLGYSLPGMAGRGLDAYERRLGDSALDDGGATVRSCHGGGCVIGVGPVTTSTVYRSHGLVSRLAATLPNGHTIVIDNASGAFVDEDLSRYGLRIMSDDSVCFVGTR